MKDYLSKVLSSSLKKNLFSLIFLTAFLSSESMQSTCPKYNCDVLDNDVCMKVDPVSSGGVPNYSVTIEYCGGTNFCDYENVSTWSETEQTTFLCKEKDNKPLVHKEKCNENSDCASNLCDGVCIGIAASNTCTATNECIIGYYCGRENEINTSKVCLPQKTLDSACSLDEECENTMGCFDGKCTKFWSVPDEVDMPSDAMAEMFCSSGFRYGGKCETLVNINTMPYNCTDSCLYRLKSNNEVVDLPELCTCGYNPEGTKYCQHDSESLTFKKYVELSKSILDQPCHVSKRFSCSNEINYMDVINRQNYYNSWKGKYQETELCLIDFFSGSSFTSLSFLTLFLLFFLF